MAGAVVVVLGYSEGGSDGLHPICAARVAHAAALAEDARAVVLTGWSRSSGRIAEAELMRRAWPDGRVELHCDAGARRTSENAAHAVALAHRLGARELTVVTSAWHRPRAALLFRLVAGRGLRVRTVGAPGPWPPRLVLRELASLVLVPAQAAAARRRLRKS